MTDTQRGLHPGGEPATEPAPELQVPPDHRLCQLPGESGRPFCVRAVGQATCPTCPDVSPSPTRTGGGVGWDWATIQRVAEFLGRPDSPGYRRAADQLRNLMAEVGALRAEQDAHEGELGDRRAQLSAAEAEVDRLRRELDDVIQELGDQEARDRHLQADALDWAANDGIGEVPDWGIRAAQLRQWAAEVRAGTRTIPTAEEANHG